MITILTSHNHIWQIDQVVIDTIKEYQELGQATIFLNNEGPCCDSVGLYRVLNNVCDKFNFDKSKITILTCNREEHHDDYTIKILDQPWVNQTFKSCLLHGYTRDDFYKRKIILKNLFGCLYNIPSWNRLNLVAYIKNHTKRSSLLACNGTWEAHCHNSYYLNSVTDFCPTEIYNIVDLIRDGIYALPGHPGTKPSPIENTKILEYYNDFFIDVVAETYTNGLTFFPTEKTFRPIYAMTPFIIFGPQGFISTLKSDYGFKSFDKWWDESYDTYQNYERIQKIYGVIDYIDRKSDSELIDMYHDMTDTLEYNFEQLKKINAK